MEDSDEDAEQDNDRQCDVYDSKFELWKENAELTLPEGPSGEKRC